MRRHRVVLVLLVSGCHAWRTRPASEIGDVGRTIRVSTDSGRRAAVLEQARVVADSVVGRLARIDTLRMDGWAPLRRGNGERTAIPIAAITRVDVRELDKRRTYVPLMVLGATVGLVLLVAVSIALSLPVS